MSQVIVRAFWKNWNFLKILKNSSRDDDFTVSFEQEVERDLMQQLSVLSTKKNHMTQPNPRPATEHPSSRGTQ
ncbi:15466_t:CDS:2 [Funneliformis mosseae]|uniref:15466_t:CDS:1 n=1 Tax=Funneliformis mosseae TaxID=27381 RepID=A0A9N9AM64_FUNMO|nr:15466_t:CDS:2 [Funneliformis mosseae]